LSGSSSLEEEGGAYCARKGMLLGGGINNLLGESLYFVE